MRFRSEEPVRIVSENGVHSAYVGPTWRELPKALHEAAMQTRGVEFDKTAGKVEKTEQAASNPNAPNQTGEDGIIRGAIEALLAKNDDADFTSGGHPRVDAVNAVTAANHTKADVTRVWDAMVAENAAKAEAEAATKAKK